MIKIIDDILSKDECLEVINQAKNKLVQAKILGAQIDGYRTANNTWLYDETELTIKIKKIIEKETGINFKHQEKIHIVKYDVGGEYKGHHDFFHPNTDYYKSSVGQTGQRVYSCLFYLNEEFSGGETEFEKRNLKVTPKTGRLLIWRNLKEDGSLDYDSYHAGLPVTAGEKWIAIIWVRENPF